ncbi:hypothetical protein B9Z55_017140 [Caenorhabditis nigoni]|uniref:Uncharacterized protein n=2 Tax=Caenorhabditis nigoni TaxID=1611254 RepID=A0A2G5T7S1_9PELO|nr:hypothetical protein B9Z55_017140 [Caenorhabditis nigoni]
MMFAVPSLPPTPGFAAPMGRAPRKRSAFAVPVGPAPKRRSPPNFSRPRILSPIAPAMFIRQISTTRAVLPPPDLLMTVSCVRSLQRKLTCLTVLVKHPNSEIHLPTIMKLIHLVHTLIANRSTVATESTIRKYQECLATMKDLEEICVRCVIQGENMEDVKESIKARQLQNSV